MTDERAMRFNDLISEIEVAAERIRLGLVEDVPFAVEQLHGHAVEAFLITREVSREALDKVVGTRPSPHPFDGPGQRCLACGDSRSMHPDPEDL